MIVPQNGWPQSSIEILSTGIKSDDWNLCIRDVGPWSRFMTVTNNAERVVEWLVASEYMCANGKILYEDSEGDWDYLLVKDGKFAGFAPGERRG